MNSTLLKNAKEYRENVIFKECVLISFMIFLNLSALSINFCVKLDDLDIIFNPLSDFHCG